MDSLRIAFELRPLAEVVPWGSPETGLTLHWFGLTDGWYDLVIGEHRLFSGPDETRGIDYHVVRLWEDLIEIAPRTLENIPEELLARLSDLDAWNSWTEKAWDLDDRSDLVSVALSWWWERQLDSGHLVGAPRLRMWRVGDDLRLHWDSLPREPDGPTWSSPEGAAIMNAEIFREELIRFDRDLMTAMDARVTAIEQSWTRPEIKIDLVDLRRDHTRRLTTLTRSFQGPQYRQHAWDDVVAAVVELERRVGPVDLG